MPADNPPGDARDIHIDGPNTGNFTDVAAGARVGDIISGPVVQGDVVVIQMPAPAGTLLREAPTAAPPAAPISGVDPSSVDVSPYAAIVAQALAGLRSAEASGQTVDAVQAGVVRVSKVELLLKRAAVVKAEAAQMMTENVQAKQPELQALQPRFQRATWSDPGAMEGLQREQESILWRDFDEEGFRAKLSEARDLLNEALTLEDTNTEALLQLAELLMALTPDDVSDEERVLTRAHALLSHASTEDDRFKQAQALMLSAQSLALKHQRTAPGPELTGAVQTCVAALTEARDQFRRLERTMWATMADQMLQGLQGAAAAMGSPPATSPASPSPPFAAPAPVWGQPAPPAAYAAPYSFQPAGQWSVNVSIAGVPTESAYLAMGYDQSMQATVSPSGMTIQGRWDFMPVTATLVLQGVANGMIPYGLQLQILQAGPAAALGMDARGATYQFTRTG
jgi:hypothetical protein